MLAARPDGGFLGAEGILRDETATTAWWGDSPSKLDQRRIGSSHPYKSGSPDTVRRPEVE